VEQTGQMQLVAIARPEYLPRLAAERPCEPIFGIQLRIHPGRKHHCPWLVLRGG